MTRVDQLMLAADILGDVDAPEETLLKAAYRFLASGGAVTLTEYAALGPQSKAALYAASRRIERERGEAMGLNLTAQAEELGREAADHVASMIAEGVRK